MIIGDIYIEETSVTRDIYRESGSTVIAISRYVAVIAVNAP